jgi:hypothetical protein
MRLDAITALTIFWAALGFGMWLGGHIRDARWSGAANGEPRVYHRGRFYHVVRDGDLGKAKRVVDGMHLDRIYENQRGT